MKLSLPPSLLAALLVLPSVTLAQESTTEPYYEGGALNYEKSYYSLATEVEHATDFDYTQKHGASTVLGVGTRYGDGSLLVTNGATVTVGGSVHVAGWGFSDDMSSVQQNYDPHSGSIYVGPGSTFIGGATNNDVTNSQFNIGSGRPEGATETATVVVDNGTLIANARLNVALGSNAQGTLHVKNGGDVYVALPADRYGTNTVAEFTVGYYDGSDGKVIVEGEGSTLSVTAEGGRKAHSYIGLHSSASIEVKDGGVVDLGDGSTCLGYNGTGEGVINVEGEGSSITLSATTVGREGSGELNVSAGGNAAVEGELNLGSSAGATGTVTVSGAESRIVVSDTSYIGNKGSGTLNVTGGGSVTTEKALNVGAIAGGSGTVTVDGADSSLTAMANTVLGSADSAGTLELTDGATAEMKAVTANGTSTVSITGGSSATMGNGFMGLTVGKDAKVILDDAPAAGSTGTAVASSLTVNGFLTNRGTVEATLSEGGSLEVRSLNNSGTMGVELAKGATFSSQDNVSNSGAMTLDVAGDASYQASKIINNDGAELNVTLADGGTLETSTLDNKGDMTVSVSDGASYSAMVVQNTGTTTVELGEGGTMSAGSVENSGTGVMTVNVAKGATFTSEDSLSNTSQGTVNVALAEGSTFNTKAVENQGNMTVTIDKDANYSAQTVTNTGTMGMELKDGATMTVDTFVNKGESTITAAENTTCSISNLDLTGGSMKLDGDGSFDLGGEAGGMSSEFYITGATETTNIDISSLEGAGNIKFTIDKNSVFTLNFGAEALQSILGGQEQTFTLTLVYGYEGFSVDENTLAALLNNTVYNFETELAMELAVAQDVAAAPLAVGHYVKDAAYKMDGKNLVWTGTVRGLIPEPTTATLSLLGLAALAARRRRR